MATMLPESETKSDEVLHHGQPSLPDASALEDKMPDWFRTPRAFAVCGLLLAVAFWFFGIQRLIHTDVWGHLSYGRYLLAAESIPATEPLMPLASGVRFVDTAWLTQIAAVTAYRTLGPTALQAMYALAIVSCLALLMWRLYARTGGSGWALLGCLAFLVTDWQQLMVIRPQLGGLVCFVGVLTLMTGRNWRWSTWIVLPAILVLWTNLHGSFVMGLALLGAMTAGRGLDLLRRTRTLRSLWHDVRFRRLFLLTELATVATLLNPYGLAIYPEVLTFAGNPNLADLLEWDPLTLRMTQGRAAAAVALLLMIAYRITPRRVTAGEVLLLIGLGGAALWTSRMIIWWGPVAALLLALHAHAICARWWKSAPATEPPQRSSTWTVSVLGLLFISFGLTPFGMHVMHGENPELSQLTSFNTPIEATRWLNENPPRGQIFNSYTWGDYLTWAGPENMQIFVNSHAHLVPREVWQHYMVIANAGGGWDDLLDRYSVNTVVVDTARREGLIDGLRNSEDWEIGYEDNVAAIFVRREPI